MAQKDRRAVLYLALLTLARAAAITAFTPFSVVGYRSRDVESVDDPTLEAAPHADRLTAVHIREKDAVTGEMVQAFHIVIKPAKQAGNNQPLGGRFGVASGGLVTAFGNGRGGFGAADHYNGFLTGLGNNGRGGFGTADHYNGFLTGLGNNGRGGFGTADHYNGFLTGLGNNGRGGFGAADHYNGFLTGLGNNGRGGFGAADHYNGFVTALAGGLPGVGQGSVLEAVIEVFVGGPGITPFQRLLVFLESAEPGMTNTASQCELTSQGAVLTQPNPPPLSDVSSSALSGGGSGLFRFGFRAAQHMLNDVLSENMGDNFNGIIATVTLNAGFNSLQIKNLGPFTRKEHLGGRGVALCEAVTVGNDGRRVCTGQSDVPISFCATLGFDYKDGGF